MLGARGRPRRRFASPVAALASSSACIRSSFRAAIARFAVRTERSYAIEPLTVSKDSAGGPEKCAWVKEIGADAVIDYKAEPDLKAALAKAAPKGIDVYFDNVGGAHLEAAIESARPFARFAECGMIGDYNATEAVAGPANIMQVVGKRIRMEGFIVVDFQAEAATFAAEMGGWIKDGAVRWKETIDEGVEAAPGAFLKLFSGENMGKMLVKLG